MIEFFHKLFATDFMPHIFCLRSPGLVWLNVVSDGLIAIAYFLIPLGLIRLVQRRRDLAFHWLFILFATFILSCGATHIMAIITLWTPVYRFDVLIKLITAVASVVTAILLIRLIPQIANLPSPEQWRLSNQELKAEVAQRKSAEDALLVLNAELEGRVEQRTKELEAQNASLRELKAAWDLSHGFIRDLGGLITFWCQGSEQLYGWKKEEAMGRISHELLATRFPEPLEQIERELQEKDSWSGELIHSTQSGERLHVAAHWVLQRNIDGEPVSVIEVNNDITDRLRAQEALQRLADIVESSNDAIIGSMLDGAITTWNTSAETLFGYSAAEMIGRSVELLIPPTPRDGEQERRISNGVGQGRGAHRYETIRCTKDGREIDVALTISPIRNSDGVVIGTSQIIRDISETKAREAAFRVSEERQRLAVEAGQVGLWYLDLASNRCIWTQRCKELHGVSEESPVPDYPAVLDLIHADDRPALLQAMKQTIIGNGELLMEYRTRGLDYRTKWLQTRGRAQRSPGGDVVGIHGTVVDLTSRRQTEDKLRRVNTELEQFAYAAAHDLQEPLRNVALAAALLKNESSHVAADDQPHLLSVVVENARRMEAMVKDLLTYSRSVEGFEDKDATSNGDAVLDRVLQNLDAAIREKHATITRDSLPQICMHETHLLQVLQNLIGNALKYGGVENLSIHIGGAARHEEVLIVVKDNGVGIAPQFHERAFRMFKRLHDESVQGTGIGLAVCKRIIEHYGGKIWIESAAGEGATFFFTVPLTETCR